MSPRNHLIQTMILKLLFMFISVIFERLARKGRSSFGKIHTHSKVSMIESIYVQNGKVELSGTLKRAVLGHQSLLVTLGEVSHRLITTMEATWPFTCKWMLAWGAASLRQPHFLRIHWSHRQLTMWEGTTWMAVCGGHFWSDGGLGMLHMLTRNQEYSL